MSDQTDVGVDESRVPVLILKQDTGYDLLVPAGILLIWTSLLCCTQDAGYDLLVNCSLDNIYDIEVLSFIFLSKLV